MEKLSWAGSVQGRYANRLDTVDEASTAKIRANETSERSVKPLTWELMGALGGTQTPQASSS
jgi:hypothetical protein